MLKSLNNTYIIIALILFSLVFGKTVEKYILVTGVSILSVISYYTLLQSNASMNKKFYSRKFLALEVFTYSLLFITLYNAISYYYTNNFLIFSASDALGYHEFTKIMVNMSSLDKALDYYLTDWAVTDLGMVMLMYPMYHVVESNLILNAFYLLSGVITSLSLFRLSRNFMSTQYAFMSALAYSTSSFILFFHTTGLKESFMVMMAIFSIDFYYQFNKTNKIKYLIYLLICFGILVFFRPAIPAMIIVSVVVGSVFSKKGSLVIKSISFLLLLSLVFLWEPLMTLMDSYTGGDVEILIEGKQSQGMIIGSIPFTYAVNVLAQTLGPLPTLVSEEKVKLTFYAAGLMYRVLLAIPFWLGILYIFKTKIYNMYPLMVFVLMEMLALIGIMEGLELRKSLSHIPLVFIIAFWFLDQYDKKNIQFKNKKLFKIFMQTATLFLFIIMLYWNTK